MLSVAVHKDIAEYQPKIVGKMTMRTLVSITGALSVSVLAGLYIYCFGAERQRLHLILSTPSRCRFWCVGFCEALQDAFEQFAPLWLKANFTNDRIFYKPSMRLADFSESETASRKEPSMENTTERGETFAASNLKGQDGSSLNAAFDVDAFVHASGDGFRNTAPLRSDTGAIDMDAISQVAHVTQGAGKLTRKEKKHAKREMKRRKKEAKKAEKEAKTYSSTSPRLKDRGQELSDKMADARKKRDSAKDVVNYIGYNQMYQDGICEVEEGMFSSFHLLRRHQLPLGAR